MKLEKTISLIKNEISLCDDAIKRNWGEVYMAENLKYILNNILKTLRKELKEEATK